MSLEWSEYVRFDIDSNSGSRANDRSPRRSERAILQYIRKIQDSWHWLDHGASPVSSTSCSEYGTSELEQSRIGEQVVRSILSH